MRTTTSLADDLDRRVRDIAHATNRAYKDVLNEALRKGLGVPMEAKPFQVKTFRLEFRPGHDLEKLNQLNDELETDEFLTAEQRSRSTTSGQ